MENMIQTTVSYSGVMSKVVAAPKEKSNKKWFAMFEFTVTDGEHKGRKRRSVMLTRDTKAELDSIIARVNAGEAVGINMVSSFENGEWQHNLTDSAGYLTNATIASDMGHSKEAVAEVQKSMRDLMKARLGKA
jgi:hypothetical protein